MTKYTVTETDFSLFGNWKQSKITYRKKKPIIFIN